MKKERATAPLPPRVQPPCALCEKYGHPTNKCPSLPRATQFNSTPSSTDATRHALQYYHYPPNTSSKGCEPNSHAPSVLSMAIIHTIVLDVTSISTDSNSRPPEISARTTPPTSSQLMSLTSTMSRPQSMNV
jgi:hypothetical protein